MNTIQKLRKDLHRRRIEREYRKSYDLIDEVRTAGNKVCNYLRNRVKRADKARSEEINHLCECFELERWEAHSVMDEMRFK